MEYEDMQEDITRKEYEGRNLKEGRNTNQWNMKACRKK
jgi:hypothetical protein